MMVLYIYHGDNGMEMMIQEVYSTYMVGGMFCYGLCQDMMVQYVLLWYGCGMFHGCYDMVVVCSMVVVYFTRASRPGE